MPRNFLTKAILALAALCLLPVLGASCKKQPAAENKKDQGHKCAFCNMKVKLPQSKLGARIVFKDGREEYYCEMGHAMMGWRIETVDEPDPANPPAAFHVVDYFNEGVIEARDSSFVVGSDVESGMFTQSVVSFGNHEAAKRFAEEHGGQVYLFDEKAVKKFAELHDDEPQPAGALTQLEDLGRSKWKKETHDGAMHDMPDHGEHEMQGHGH